MLNAKSLLNSLKNINQHTFDSHALAIFKWQATHNFVYNSYLNNLGVVSAEITCINDIPFLPISFFKTHSIKSNDWLAQKVFESSGTSGDLTSKHSIQNLDFYHSHAANLFTKAFGAIQDLHILALLPSYLERDSSSLVSMVQHFIGRTSSEFSGFYLHNLQELANVLVKLKKQQKKVVLVGVTFALLDLAEQFSLNLSHVTLIETGGMKGRREEITRENIYKILNEKLNFKSIYSEYGMTELLSQAYGKNAKFTLPYSMKIFIREVSDPFSFAANGKIGGINVIDLANVHTCSFIETQDLGRINKDGTFEVLGRFDNSDLRGCNLLVS